MARYGFCCVLLLCMFAFATAQPRMPQPPELPNGGPMGGDAFNTMQMPQQMPMQGQQQQQGAGQFGGFPGAAPQFGAPVGQMGGAGGFNAPGAGFGGLGQPPAFGPAFGAGGQMMQGAQMQGGQMQGGAGMAGMAQQQPQQQAAGAGGAQQATPAGSPFGIAPSVFPQEAIQNLQNSYAQRMGYSPLLNAGLSNQMMGGGVNFAAQNPAYNPQGFNPQQYGIGAGAAAQAAPQQRMQAFQMPQPAATFNFPMPGAQQYQQQQQQQNLGGYQPTASPSAIAAANQGYNNMLLGLGQGMTNLGRNMAQGPPPAPVSGMAVVQQQGNGGGYRGATLRATYPGIGAVDLGVPKVGEGGVSAILNEAANTNGAAGGTTVLPMQTETLPTITERVGERAAA